MYSCVNHRGLKYQTMHERNQTKSKWWPKSNTQLENRNMRLMGQSGPNMGQNTVKSWI